MELVTYTLSIRRCTTRNSACKNRTRLMTVSSLVLPHQLNLTIWSPLLLQEDSKHDTSIFSNIKLFCSNLTKEFTNFFCCYSNAPPVSTGIFSLGSFPYCAWHYAVEGSAAPLLSDVAYALASKVTSKFFSKTR